MRRRPKWKGVEWAPIVGGRCTKHKVKVTPILRMCEPCHREQLAVGQDLSVAPSSVGLRAVEQR